MSHSQSATPATGTSEATVQPVRPQAELMTRAVEADSAIPLREAPVGVPLRVHTLRADKTLEKRLISMGMPLGSEVEIVHKRGPSVVRAVGSSRIALGSEMVRKILVEVV